MRPNNELQDLLQELTAEMQQVGILWQIAVLLASVGLGWLLRQQFLKRRAAQPRTYALHISPSSMSRLLFPFAALVLTAIGRWLLQPWQSTHLLNVAVPLLFALALIRIAVYLLRRAFPRQEWLHPWERFIGWAVWFGLALHITGLLPDALALLDEISLTIGTHRLSVLLIAQGVLAFTISVLLALWLASSLEARIMGADKMGMNQRVVLSKVTRALLIILSVLIALPLVGVDLTMLSVFSGALGVGLGLGLQKIASNYVSGFIILLDRSLRIGDTVAVGDQKGEVTALTTRYAVLRCADGTEALIPNDTFITSTVVNQTYSDHRLRMILPVQVSYASPLERAMDVVLAAARKQPQVLADPEPKVLLREFADSGINLELLIWVEDPVGGQLALRSNINLEIWREFQKHGIEIPSPQREVRLHRRKAT